MLIGIAGLLVQSLLVVEEVAWKQLVSFYMEKQITSLDAVLDPSTSFARRAGDRVDRTLGKDPIPKFSDLHSSPFEDERDEEVAAVAVQSQASNHIAHARVHRAWTDAVAAGPKLNEELLKFRDQNVVVLSWFGTSGPPFFQALANIRLVGVMGAHFLAFLAREVGTPIEEMHVVGLSMGAHLASYIGSALKDMGQGKLGRITGLDPAGPHFEHTDPLVRLDPEDALFVDVIHTDTAPLSVFGLGMTQPLGHQDFYPNFGPRIPGCGLSLQDTLQKGNGSILYGVTHLVTVVLADLQISDKHDGDIGKFHITLHGSRGSSSRSRLGDDELRVRPGQRFSFLIPSPEIGEIEEILVEWEHKEKATKAQKKRSLSQSWIVIDRVVVQTLERRAKVAFCGRGRELVSGERMAMRLDDNRRCLEKPLPDVNQSLKGSLFNFQLKGNVEELLRKGEPILAIFK
ncbi:unnamed protein product [Darwinula stevensoni]|uniref:Lipase domain-containing protein n=1 Tax=Darwinula stevensoni TaxID=69355 RepID=A0A7R9A984_9CRUS|nr:unnamed protein product [Darwinula stevensoni]CAG0897057.1 unnamed protein product [Darwinula stevensoni]